MSTEGKMISNRRWKLLWCANILCILVDNVSMIHANEVTSTESSAEYLQKVMIELQELNVPSDLEIPYNGAATDLNEVVVQFHPQQQTFGSRQPQNFNIQQHAQFANSNDFHVFQMVPGGNKKVDFDPKITPHVYQMSPTGVNNNHYHHHHQYPEISALGVSRKELANMYKKALEQGSAVRLASLNNALLPGRRPHVTNTHLEIPVAKPAYTYYFFPLKTFQSELLKDNGYRTIPADGALNTAASEESQKQIASPLFMGLTTFIGMAILFVLWVLFMPKLNQFEGFKNRSIEDDILNLTHVILNAADRNILETATKSPAKCERIPKSIHVKRDKQKPR